MDVVEALEAWDGAADAWFLDGLSPALNPAMWRDEVAYDPARIRSSSRTSVAASDDGVTRSVVNG